MTVNDLMAILKKIEQVDRLRTLALPVRIKAGGRLFEVERVSYCSEQYIGEALDETGKVCPWVELVGAER